MKNWQTLYADVNWADYGGSWARKCKDGSWIVIEFTNMDDACGRDNEGNDTYLAEVRRVAPQEASVDTINSAFQCCGVEGKDRTNELALVAAMNQYGAHAPLGSHSGNSYPERVRAAARREAEEYMRDSSALDEAMDRPVNALGSTAREYAAGDFQSAMMRGVLAGNQNARIMAKMHGVDQWAIDDARPSDWLPFFMGYMDGLNRVQPPPPDEDLAPEYTLGYARGENVRDGKCPAPSWIRQAR